MNETNDDFYAIAIMCNLHSNHASVLCEIPTQDMFVA